MAQTRRDRAYIVCVQCHARKVRCDLQESSTGSCKNCQRNNQQCIRRDGLRKRRRNTRGRTPFLPPEGPNSSEGAADSPITNANAITSSLLSPAQSAAGPGTLGKNQVSNTSYPAVSIDSRRETGYIAGHSMLLPHDTPAQSTVSYELSRDSQARATAAILEATQADVLPKLPLRQALLDAFFAHLSHMYPVVDRQDLDGSGASILLQQATCLAGSLMRHGTLSKSIQLSHDLYQKAKTLIYLNHEQCSLTVLKAMCLLSIWSPNPSDSTSLDGPWQWAGAAIRVALQLGLHRQSTYMDRRDAGCRRRVWWHLYASNHFLSRLTTLTLPQCSDRLQSACFGRPLTIRPGDFDVALPTVQDFNVADISALAFVHSVSLCTIIGDISELGRRCGPVNADDMSSLQMSLCNWMQLLPEDLRLHDSVGERKPYVRQVTEMHQLYFVAIILLQALTNHHNRHWRTSVASLVASSCISRLYEEIYHREDVSFLLPINIFACMVAAVPQLYYKPQSEEQEQCRQEELGVLRSVVQLIRGKFGGADTVLRNMEALERDLGRRGLRNSRTDDPEADEPSAVNAHENMIELYPFPADFCPSMNLLLVDPSQDAFYMDNSLPLGDGLPEWIFTQDQPFLDILGVDHTIV